MIELSQVGDSSTQTGNHAEVISVNSPPQQRSSPNHGNAAIRFVLALGCVATIATFASTTTFASQAGLESKVSSSAAARSLQQSSDAGIHFDLKTLEPLKFHQSGFGALNFHQHEDADNKYRRFLSSAEVKIPVSAVDHAIPSLGEKNIMNLAGHYLHDESRSPWSSLKYNRPKEELVQEQKEFLDKMHKVREKWGSWDFKDHSDVVRPVQDFTFIEYRDISNSKWTSNVWQTDETYVKDFIKEGRKLVDRMREGIYAEFGYPSKKADGSTISAEEVAARDGLFKVHISEDATPKNLHNGLAYMNQAGFDGLARKLLHAMITNDDFYYVLAGHSAAAGHGNNHFQQKTMQFNYIMEPVFQKLGIRLMARNLAMGGYGTMHFSAGQAELYGEKDFIEWDSAMTERSASDTDLFNKQALMNGERVPIIFSDHGNNLVEETGGKVGMGYVLNTDAAFLRQTSSLDQGRTLPWLIQFQHCAPGVQLCGGRDMVDKYDGHCWVDRKDVDIDLTLGRDSVLDMHPGGGASWHPGWRTHRIASRKTALIFLEAFTKAFDIWEEGIKAGFPLAEEHWHVGDVYKDIRKTFKDYIHDDAHKGTSACEQRYEPIGVGFWCRHGMHGMSTFRPINLAQGNGIVKNVKAAPNASDPRANLKFIYTGPDLQPLSWKIPDGEVDVHAIAIATSYEAPLNEHLFDADADADADEAELGRMLRTPITAGAEEAPSSNVVEPERSLQSSGIVPGEGWGLEGPGASPDEYCDGSPQSECGRIQAVPNAHSCYMHDVNDRRNTLSGDGLSGWLLMTIPGEVKHGVIWAKLEWWHPRNNWPLTSLEGGGRMLEEKDVKRKLGKAQQYPDDVKLEIAINGKLYATWNKDKIMAQAYPELAYNEAFYKFVDEDMSVTGKNIELGLKITSESFPKGAGLGVAHIYWS